jgi:hypothetical protein
MADPGSPSPQCLACAHYRGLRVKQKRTGDMGMLMAWLACRVFPRGIPCEISAGRHDHRLPFKGDRGVRFEPRIESPKECGESE